jgi:septum formation protein
MPGIQELLHIDKPIVLASQSPRRKQLLQMLGLDFKVKAADIEENIDPDLPAEAIAIELAISKAKSVAETLRKQSIVIGADTIVLLDGEILTKPANEDEAFVMLKRLSDKTHYVMTGLAIVDSKTMKTITSYKLTEVTFRKLATKEIDDYVESGSPLDKAGAYGIQDDFGAVFVKKINGCYYNVVGLPLEELYEKLKDFFDAKKN